MPESKRITNLDRVALWPVAALLAGLAPVVWSIASVGLIVVVLVPATLAVLLSPMLLVIAGPSKNGTRGPWWPLPPCRWLGQFWLHWPWLCWTWLSGLGRRQHGCGKTGH